MKRSHFLVPGIPRLRDSQAATFTVTNTNDSGAGSLRQAILDANANPGLDTIAFNIPGSGVHTITPPSTMTISDAGRHRRLHAGRIESEHARRRQRRRLQIEIDGSGIPVEHLFNVLTSGATLRGLLINQANGYRSSSTQRNDNKVIGNWIGTDATGTQYLGTDFSAFRIYGSNNHVGGTDPADHNVIVGGGAVGGATIDPRLGGFNAIQGNHVGVNAAGTAALTASPLRQSGITLAVDRARQPDRRDHARGAQRRVRQRGRCCSARARTTTRSRATTSAPTPREPSAVGATVGIFTNNAPHDNLIGGSAAGRRKRHFRKRRSGSSSRTERRRTPCMGNFIGTDPTGLAAGPEHGRGIEIQTPSAGSAIGGIECGRGQHHRLQRGAGNSCVFSTSDADWPIRGNSIHDNAGLGIDLGGSGADPNDPGDADDGPNHLQNFPIVSSVTTWRPRPGARRSTASFTARPRRLSTWTSTRTRPAPASRASSWRARPTSDPPRSRPTAPATPSIDVTLPVAVEAGARITATATDPAGNTSEFSQRIIFSISPPRARRRAEPRSPSPEPTSRTRPR